MHFAYARQNCWSFVVKTSDRNPKSFASRLIGYERYCLPELKVIFGKRSATTRVQAGVA